MAGLGIDGLASSLDTTGIINSLMQLEARPQTLLRSTLSSTNTYLTALRSLNASAAALATSAQDAAKPTSLSAFTATSSADTVTATAGTTASAGSISFRVDRTAAAQSMVTAPATAWPDDPPVLTLVAADGTATQVTAASNSLQDVADAITAAGAGVTATRVSAGKNADGEPLYRLQLTATASGADGAFTAYRGTPADVTANTATNLLADGATQVAAAVDAKVTLWAGTAAEQELTSSTNTFTDLLTGVNITVTKPGTEPVTVDVARNATAATATASALVNKLSTLFATVSNQTRVTNTTDSSGAASVRGGTFTGDSAVRQLKDSLLSAITDPVGTESLSSIGISVTRQGGVAFDAEKFQEALAADPARTQELFATASARVADAAKIASDSADGFLAQRITGQEDAVKRLNENISAWDLRLAKRKEILQRQYTAMETALSGLQSQSTWLASQLSSL